jgi:hypothetical protein
MCFPDFYAQNLLLMKNEKVTGGEKKFVFLQDLVVIRLIQDKSDFHLLVLFGSYHGASAILRQSYAICNVTWLESFLSLEIKS